MFTPGTLQIYKKMAEKEVYYKISREIMESGILDNDSIS